MVWHLSEDKRLLKNIGTYGLLLLSTVILCAGCALVAMQSARESATSATEASLHCTTPEQIDAAMAAITGTDEMGQAIIDWDIITSEEVWYDPIDGTQIEELPYFHPELMKRRILGQARAAAREEGADEDASEAAAQAAYARFLVLLAEQEEQGAGLWGRP